MRQDPAREGAVDLAGEEAEGLCLLVAGAGSAGGRAAQQALGPERLALACGPFANDPGGGFGAEGCVAGLVVQELGVGPREQGLADESARGGERGGGDGLAKREVSDEPAGEGGLAVGGGVDRHLDRRYRAAVGFE